MKRLVFLTYMLVPEATDNLTTDHLGIRSD